MKSGLPIDEALPALCAVLKSHHAAVLQAPARAGKSTAVPLAGLGEDWAREMLELADVRTLGTRFERVWVNGRRLK